MLSNEIKWKVIGLHNTGLSLNKIHQRLKSDISIGSVHNILKNIDKISDENKGNEVFNKVIEKVKKDEIETLNAQIGLIDDHLTPLKAQKESFRSLIVSKAVLLDKRELLSGNATDRIDVQGMTHIERIQFIRTGVLPDRMGDSRVKDLLPSGSQS